MYASIAAQRNSAPGPDPDPTSGRGGHGRAAFFGVKSLDPQRVSRDADQIATEVVKHLVGARRRGRRGQDRDLGDVPDGVPDEVVRTVTENAKTLKFEQHGFEQS